MISGQAFYLIATSAVRTENNFLWKKKINLKPGDVWNGDIDGAARQDGQAQDKSPGSVTPLILVPLGRNAKLPYFRVPFWHNKADYQVLGENINF